MVCITLESKQAPKVPKHPGGELMGTCRSSLRPSRTPVTPPVGFHQGPSILHTPYLNQPHEIHSLWWSVQAATLSIDHSHQTHVEMVGIRCETTTRSMQINRSIDPLRQHSLLGFGTILALEFLILTPIRAWETQSGDFFFLSYYWALIFSWAQSFKSWIFTSLQRYFHTDKSIISRVFRNSFLW